MSLGTIIQKPNKWVKGGGGSIRNIGWAGDTLEINHKNKDQPLKLSQKFHSKSLLYKR